MPRDRQINEATGVNPEAMTVRWALTGGCAGVTETARVGTTGKLVMTCGAGTATNIEIATRIGVDTAIGIAGVTGTAWAGTIKMLVMTCGAGTATNIAIATRIAVDMAIETIGKIEAWIARTETIEAPMKVGLGVA